MHTERIYRRAMNRPDAKQTESAYVEYKLDVVRSQLEAQDKADRDTTGETRFAPIPFPVVR